MDMLNIFCSFLKDPQVYFYFFSTLAQSAAALIAIVGMFAVYRLQIQENRIRGLIQSCITLLDRSRPLLRFIDDNLVVESNIWPVNNFCNKLKQEIKSLKMGQDAVKRERGNANFEDFVQLIQHMESFAIQIEQEQSTEKMIRDEMSYPMNSMAKIFLLTIILLPLSKLLATSLLGYIIIIIISIFTVFAIQNVIHYIFKIVTTQNILIN